MGVGNQERPAPGDDDEFAALEKALTGLRTAAGFLNGDGFGVLTASLRLARRAFDEIGKFNSLLDEASQTADQLTETLSERLRTASAEGVAELVDELDQLVRTVAKSEAERAVVLRIIDGETDDEADREDEEAVPALRRSDLPDVPSLYDADEADASLEDMWRRQEEPQAEQDRIRAERVRLCGDHLRVVFAFAAARMGSVAHSEAAVEEAKRARTLWAECVADQRRNAAPAAKHEPAQAQDDAPELVAVFEIHADSNEDMWAQATWHAKLAACEVGGMGRPPGCRTPRLPVHQ